jgi:hypothetical protein
VKFSLTATVKGSFSGAMEALRCCGKGCAVLT